MAHNAHESCRSAHTHWPGTILVVDDEPKLCRVLEEFLGLHGFTVSAALSGEAGLDAVEHACPSIVLLDIKMPGLDGLATLQLIKHQRPALPIIMITGLQEEGLMERAIALGASDYIIKPFNFEYLETVLLTKVLLGRTA